MHFEGKGKENFHKIVTLSLRKNGTGTSLRDVQGMTDGYATGVLTIYTWSGLYDKNSRPNPSAEVLSRSVTNYYDFGHVCGGLSPLLLLG